MKTLKLIPIVISTCIVLLCLSISCDKKDTTKPIVEFEEPALNDTLSVTSDSVHIEFKATDDVGLHEVEVMVKNAAGTSLFTSTNHVENTTYTFHSHFKPTGITGLTPLTLTVNATDHNNNMTTATRNFTVKP